MVCGVLGAPLGEVTCPRGESCRGENAIHTMSEVDW